MKLHIERLESRQQLAGASSGFIPPQMPMTPTNATQVVKVLVVNFDPILPANYPVRHLWEYFPWNNPRTLAEQYKSEIEYASGGAIQFQITEWRDVNDIPVLANGYKYTIDEYVRRQGGIDFSPWQPGWSDFPTMARTQNLAASINSGVADEVWFFGGDNFQFFGETAMVGPDPFWINGLMHTYPEAHRNFVCNGFTYGRGVGEMMHNTAHRLEATMSRFYGGWNQTVPQTAWDQFSAISSRTASGIGGVGSCHFPVNGVSDYDYMNPRSVPSTAEDWVNYPSLTGASTLVSRDAWGGSDPNRDFGSYHIDYLDWMYGHLPRAAGTTNDGRQANWWKYLYDYNNYEATSGLEKTFSVRGYAADVTAAGGEASTFSVAFSSAYAVLVNSINTGDIWVSGPNGFRQAATLLGVGDPRDRNYVVASFRMMAPGGRWDAADNGPYAIEIMNSLVSDAKGRSIAWPIGRPVGPGPQPVEGRAIGSFLVATPVVAPPAAPTDILAVPGNESVRLFWTAPQSNGSAITDYRIQYQASDGVWRDFADGISAASDAVVTGLRNGVAYAFRVQALNVSSPGAWSSPTSRAMPSANLVTRDVLVGAGEFPGVLVGNFKRGDQITLQYRSGLWTTCDGRDAPYSPDASNGGLSILAQRDGWTCRFRVQLPAGTASRPFNYTFQQDVGDVYIGMYDAYTVDNAGAVVYRVTSTARVPNAPTDLRIGGYVGVLYAGAPSRPVLRWSPPRENGLPVLNYVVEYRTGSGRWAALLGSPFAGTTAVGPVLRNGVTYYFRVRAVNALGQGAWSAVLGPVRRQTVSPLMVS